MTAAGYCEGQDFSLCALQKWSYLLRRATKQSRATQAPRTTRLLRVRRALAEAPASSGSKIMMEISGVRLVVSAGFDGATLEAVLDVLQARAGAR
jgi:hypothetical protein